jgi:Hydrolase of X-linked nucleoside diphosphate N terminal
VRACKHRLSWAPFDCERYEQVRGVAAGILVSYTEADAALIRALLHREQGYATPKMDVRGAVCDTNRSYSGQEKIDVLVHLPHALTIFARDTYEVGREGLIQPSRPRCITEVQHRVLGYLSALMKQDAQRYSDDVLVRLFLEHPEDRALQQQLQAAFSHLTAQLAVTT